MVSHNKPFNSSFVIFTDSTSSDIPYSLTIGPSLFFYKSYVSLDSDPGYNGDPVNFYPYSRRCTSENLCNRSV